MNTNLQHNPAQRPHIPTLFQHNKSNHLNHQTNQHQTNQRPQTVPSTRKYNRIHHINKTHQPLTNENNELVTAMTLTSTHLPLPTLKLPLGRIQHQILTNKTSSKCVGFQFKLNFSVKFEFNNVFNVKQCF